MAAGSSLTFDLATAADWDYFTEGAQLAAETAHFAELAHAVDHPSAEPLIPTRTWGYHDPRQHPDYLPVDLVDYYRCWPCAQPLNAFVEAVRVNGITSPLVIYSDGFRGLLGEGNHRLAAAKEIGLSMVPVVVIPDRLLLPQGMDVSHLSQIDPEVSRLTAVATRRHHGVHPGRESVVAHRHQLSTHTNAETVYVFCACGAYWRRPDHE